MTTEHVHLAQPRLTIVSGELDPELQHIAQTIAHHVVVSGRLELEVVLGRLLVAAAQSCVMAAPRTLDLIGHTAADGSLLLGDWAIDGASATTRAFFRGLADHAVLPRLGVRAVRLLGCGSAATPCGQATLAVLSELLGLEVYGARQLLYAAHYDAGGFRDDWQFLLAGAHELRPPPREVDLPPAQPYPRTLDVDALPAVALGPPDQGLPRRIASMRAARDILQLVRRSHGARLSGVVTPAYELALPAVEPDTYHVAHVLFGGAFVQFYPDGPAGPAGPDRLDGPAGSSATGIAFPVEDAGALLQLIAALPSGSTFTG